MRYDDGTTYADPNMFLTNATTYEWPHSLSEIIGSLLKAGLTLTAFDEHRTIPLAGVASACPNTRRFHPPVEL